MPQNKFLDYGGQMARGLNLLAQQASAYRQQQLRADLANAETARRDQQSFGQGLSQIGGAIGKVGEQYGRNKALDDYLASEAFTSLGPEDQARKKTEVEFARMGMQAPGFVGQVGFKEQLGRQVETAETMG